MGRIILKILLPIFLSLNLYAIDELQEIQELKEQVKSILNRIDALEKKMKPQVSQNKVNVIATQNPPQKQKGFLELKSSQSVLSIGGRIQLDTKYSWPEGEHFGSKIALGGSSGENGHITFDAKNSRLWVKTRTPTKYGPLRALVEIDFMGTAKGTEISTNSSGPRLRHAYVQVANWTIGQTNSAFNTHTTLDNLYYPINDVFVRQPLIRYGVEDKDISYDISFEQPETTLLDSDGNKITPKDDVIPDIIARIRHYPLWGEIGASFMGRYINQDRTGNLNNRDSAIGWAVNVSGKVNVFDKDDIRFGAQYGDGLGRYVAYGTFTAGSVDEEGRIKLQETYGGHIGYRHWWSETLRSNISFSYAATKNNNEILSAVANLSDINKEIYSTQINLIWTPIPNSLIGFEYAKAYREVESGEQGDLDTAMLRFLYDF